MTINRRFEVERSLVAVVGRSRDRSVDEKRVGATGWGASSAFVLLIGVSVGVLELMMQCLSTVSGRMRCEKVGWLRGNERTLGGSFCLLARVAMSFGLLGMSTVKFQ